MMKVKCKNVDELKTILRELNLIAKPFVINGMEATELYILLKELEATLTRGKEKIIEDGCLYDRALLNLGVINVKEYKSFAKDLYKININIDTKINYELEFKEDKVGSYNIYFGDNNFAHINIFKPNRIYKNTRIVKNLIEDPESYIESYNIDNGYIIIRNDNIDKFVIFTNTDKGTDNFNYLAPEEYCNDKNRI